MAATKQSSPENLLLLKFLQQRRQERRAGAHGQLHVPQQGLHVRRAPRRPSHSLTYMTRIEAPAGSYPSSLPSGMVVVPVGREPAQKQGLKVKLLQGDAQLAESGALPQLQPAPPVIKLSLRNLHQRRGAEFIETVCKQVCRSPHAFPKHIATPASCFT